LTSLHALYIKALFRIRDRVDALLVRPVRWAYWSLQGMRIGKGTFFRSLHVKWPHQVKIGRNCIIEYGVYFHFDGIYCPGPSIVIGDDCFIGSGCEFNITAGIEIGNKVLIGSGCRFVDHNHGIALGIPMRSQPNTAAVITVEDDTWIGANAVILAGVSIGAGAVIAAGAVVTQPVPGNAIAGGVPAKILRYRDSADPAQSQGLTG
jgi:acetyltransferase-like isoleucine patch superfamily enzyme